MIGAHLQAEEQLQLIYLLCAANTFTFTFMWDSQCKFNIAELHAIYLRFHFVKVLVIFLCVLSISPPIIQNDICRYRQFDFPKGKKCIS